MAKLDKFLTELLSGTSDSNISFRKLTSLLRKLEFKCRIQGSHHIFYREDIEEIINLQSRGNKAKTYQVKQVRNLLLKYNLLKDE